MSGFDRADLSLLASRATVEEKLGHGYRSVRELEDDAAVPVVAYVANESIGDAEGAVAGILIYVGSVATAGAILASGGTLGAAIAAAAASGYVCASLGLLLDRMIERSHLQRIEEQVAAGGLLLWVHLRDDAHAERATAILTKAGGQDVHVHELTTAAREGAAMRQRIDDLIDEAGAESFPASDAPAFSPSTAGGPH
ncbi:hypothetical protein [Aurantimonas sp. VKM B-3413]|uniref:hypothetical protein n=1 Tax=Aurantimonas sp. VKM B-3413 TaxID=2779401 RepID=UPI001E482400|nr:hypothetical protein [Aurantimonas sp. VKM B-3413]MCB8840169.1 hypothetical protein [Aurantimonas sp. VKM B-3413]